MSKVYAIAAMDEGRVIGQGNKLPWHIPQDMKHFSELTRGHAVLMGRKTWESLPEKFRPLPGRKNIVVSRWGVTLPPEVLRWSALEPELREFKAGTLKLGTDILWVIGGASIYAGAMPFCDAVFLTLVKGRHEGDAFFPPFEDGFELVTRESGGSECEFLEYRRRGGSPQH